MLTLRFIAFQGFTLGPVFVETADIGKLATLIEAPYFAVPLPVFVLPYGIFK